MWMVSLGASTFNRPGQLASLQAAESLLTGVSHTQSIRETGSVLLGPLKYIGMLIRTFLQLFKNVTRVNSVSDMTGSLALTLKNRTVLRDLT